MTTRRQLKKNKGGGVRNPVMPDQKQGHSGVTVTQETEAAVFTGPIPPPEALEKYNTVLPGAADRILTMAEQNSEHGRSLDKEVVALSHKYARTGQLLGFGIGIVALSIAAFCAYIGQTIPATAIGVSVPAALVAAFLKTKR